MLHRIINHNEEEQNETREFYTVAEYENTSIDSKKIKLEDNEATKGDYFNMHSLIPIGKGKCGET